MNHSMYGGRRTAKVTIQAGPDYFFHCRSQMHRAAAAELTPIRTT
jgi:hypothetical protein